ncbi:MAG: 16S rRNA (uracil(1498)-N(3))-methyltransferase [Sulfuricaulis sp.]|nr:16S rRNA (uracil(1498)-N(3))-methyltransferase [Sulfuricaulis sp.]
MTEPLFYAARLADPGAIMVIAGDEARHAAASRRLKSGDTLWLFDGNGSLARTILLKAGGRRHGLEVRIEDRRTEPAPRPERHLACALPKGDRQSVLLDMATQLGVTRFTPLECERSVVKAGGNSPGRWRKICLEACKQSRRFYLPVIESPTTVQDVTTKAIARGSRVWVAHPGEESVTVIDAVNHTPGDVTLLIGPEGGFTHEEIGLAVGYGAGVLRLGNSILRIETAAVALIAAFAISPRPHPVNPRGELSPADLG